MNVRFILKILGSILLLEFIFMLIATGVSLFYGESDRLPFVCSSAIILAAGMLLNFLGRNANEYQAGRREGMLTVTLLWTVLSFFGMLPFLFGGYINNVTDAYLETMSGFTTTGVTTVSDIESLPHGILFWRSLIQWQGGIGVVVFTVALLPMFGGSASQLFNAETPGITHERFRPRITQVAKRLSVVYIIMTLFFAGLLWLGPMNLFDAVIHSMSGISTGGYSSKNASVAYWNSAYTDYVLMACMLIGGINLTLWYFMILKGRFGEMLKDEETHWYIAHIFVCILITVIILTVGNETNTESIGNTIRKAAFQIISITTTTGYLTADYSQWGAFFAFIALISMIVCGCAGSTSGGLKTGRMTILLKNLTSVFRQQTHPAAIITTRLNNRVLPQETIHRVHVFATAYFMLIFISWGFLILNGIGFDDAIGIAVSAIGNVGPALGSYTTGNIQDLSDISKWYISFIMMTGRLEIFTVLTLFLPGFWKR